MSLMLKITVSDQTVLNSLRRALRAMDGRKSSELMQRISASMAAAVEENFEAEGRPKWESLKPPTIAERTEKGFWPGKILHRTGGLKRSITKYSSATEAVVGTNEIYARILHQGGVIRAKKAKALRFGGKAGVMARSVRITAREFLKMTDEDLQDLSEEINDWYMQLLQQK